MAKFGLTIKFRIDTFLYKPNILSFQYSIIPFRWPKATNVRSYMPQYVIEITKTFELSRFVQRCQLLFNFIDYVV